MSGLFAQFKAFILTMILGIGTGVIFQYYQLTIRRANLGRFTLYFLDFILWVMLIFIVFVGMLLINQGEMRVYVLISLLIGVVIYYKCIAAYFERPLGFAANSTVLIIKSIYTITQKGLEVCRNFVKQRFKKDDDPPPNDNDE